MLAICPNCENPSLILCPSVETMAAEGGKEFSSSKKYLVVKQTCGCHGIRSVMIGVDDYGDQYSWEYELSVTQIVSGKSTRFDRG